MPKKKRTKPPTILWKRLFQEARGQCPFCDETAVESLQIHHIDGDPANNARENVILVCANCHQKITVGALTEADVRLRKSQVAAGNDKTSGAWDASHLPPPLPHDPTNPVDEKAFDLEIDYADPLS